MKRITIGIDPGVNTGIAVAVDGVLERVETCRFWEAHCLIMALHAGPDAVELVIEDPRGQRVAPSQYNSARLRGVGSVERDAKLWIEYAEHYGIPYRAVKPGKLRKIDAATFAKLTGWTGRTSEHARAAAMMVHERTKPNNP
jgi:hypothetical protein